MVREEEESGLIRVEDWRIPDVQYLIDVGFDFQDDFKLGTTKDPKIVIYKKKNEDETNEGEKKIGSYYYVEEEDRDPKRFATIHDVIDYFDTYSQPELDKHK